MAKWRCRRKTRDTSRSKAFSSAPVTPCDSSCGSINHESFPRVPESPHCQGIKRKGRKGGWSLRCDWVLVMTEGMWVSNFHFFSPSCIVPFFPSSCFSHLFILFYSSWFSFSRFPLVFSSCFFFPFVFICFSLSFSSLFILFYSSCLSSLFILFCLFFLL